MTLRIVSESSVEPVTLDEVKVFLRLESTDSTSEDTLLNSYIIAARKQAENFTKRALVSTTWNLFIDDFPANSMAAISLPRPPLSTVSTNLSISYVLDTTAGPATTLNSTVYTVDSDTEPGRVYPQFDSEWPTDVRNQRNAVTVEYVSGYTTATMPEEIKTWIKLRVSQMYEYREPLVDINTVRALPRTFVDGLLDPYTIKTFS